MVPVSAKEGRRPRSLRGGRGHRSPVRKNRLSPTIALVPTRHCNGALATADNGPIVAANVLLSAGLCPAHAG
jgi:hypothetical protein